MNKIDYIFYITTLCILCFCAGGMCEESWSKARFHNIMVKNGIGHYKANEITGKVNFYCLKVNPSLSEDLYPYLGGKLTTKDGNLTYDWKYEQLP